MKTKILAATVLCAVSISAMAQSVSSTTGQTQSSGSTSAATVAPNTGNGNTIVSNGADSVRTVGNAPGFGAAVSFSSDYCGGTASASGGWLGGALGGSVPIIDTKGCGNRRNFERVQQAAATEPDPAIARNLRDASYEILAEVSPEMRGILSRRGVIHGQAAVAYDNSGTTGMQPANYRVEAK